APTRPRRVAGTGLGVPRAEDPPLVEELPPRPTPPEVCPGSTRALGLYPARSAHPLHRLIAAGVRVTLGSDDPPFFHTTLGMEYDQSGLGERELRRITRTAIEASFADMATKVKLLQGGQS